MAILLKSGGLFLHVPKTGGNWVTEVLESNKLVFAHVAGKHAGPAQLAPLEHLLEIPRRYDRPNRASFRFCFVRHPLSWYESWYRMNVDRGWPEWATDEDAWNPSVELNGLGASTFDRFIENVLRHRPGFLARLYRFYAADAHFVGRQEHLAEDLNAVLTLLHVEFDAAGLRRHPRANLGAPANVDLSRELHEALADAEHDAFSMYGSVADQESNIERGPTVLGLRPAERSLTPPFAHNGGFAWTVSLPAASRFADELGCPRRSMLRVTEDDVLLGGPHAPHDDIRDLGGGRFSHWNDVVILSTSDNSDPNKNRRRYGMTVSAASPSRATTLMTPQPHDHTGVAA